MRRTPLNRGRPPERRTQLARGTGLARGAGPQRRTRLRSAGPVDQAVATAKAEQRELMFARDRQACRLAHVWPTNQGVVPPCIGPLTPHHLRKAGQGGPYTLINLLTLCAGHNDWIEAAPRDLVHGLGLVMNRGDTYPEVWGRLVAAGIVDWWWTGARPPA